MDFVKLTEWTALVDEIQVVAKPLIDRERKLRRELFEQFFPDPKEGTNYAALENGWRLKGIHKVTRTVDEAALPAVRDTLFAMGISTDTLVEWKPNLKMATYKELDEEARKVFDEALTMRPSSPTVELVPPKGAR